MLVIMRNCIFMVTRKLVELSITLVHFNYDELYTGIHGYKIVIKREIYKNKSKRQSRIFSVGLFGHLQLFYIFIAKSIIANSIDDSVLNKNIWLL
jgi:hypothetical protein